MRSLVCLSVALGALVACGYKPGPEVAETRRTLEMVSRAVQNYKKDMGKFPPNLTDLVDKPTGKEDLKKWKGPYIKDIPRDAWGNNLVYHPTGSNGAAFDVISYGADGKEGGKNDDQDLGADPRTFPKPKK
jgi:general secretion pathway protein G